MHQKNRASNRVQQPQEANTLPMQLKKKIHEHRACPVGLPGFITTKARTVKPLDLAVSSWFFSSEISNPHPVASSR